MIFIQSEKEEEIFFSTKLLVRFFVFKISVTIRRDVTFNIRLVSDLFFPLFMLSYVSVSVSEKTKNDLIVMFHRERKKNMSG